MCTISVKCIFRPLYIWSTCTRDWWRACVICFLGFKSNVFFIIVNYARRIWSVSKRIRGYSSTCQILKYIWHLTARDQANKLKIIYASYLMKIVYVHFLVSDAYSFAWIRKNLLCCWLLHSTLHLFKLSKLL